MFLRVVCDGYASGIRVENADSGEKIDGILAAKCIKPNGEFPVLELTLGAFEFTCEGPITRGMIDQRRLIEESQHPD